MKLIARESAVPGPREYLTGPKPSRHRPQSNVALTDRAVALGWRRPDPPGRFDLLPLLVSVDGGVPELFELPEDAVLEVELTHPEHEWFAELALRWHAVPRSATCRWWSAG